MKKIFRRTIAVLSIIALIFMQCALPFSQAFAIDTPSTPKTPSAPKTASTPATPTTPAPIQTSTPAPTPTPTQVQAQLNPSPTSTPIQTPTPTPTGEAQNTSGSGQSDSNQVGDTTITSGDANTTGTVSNIGNINTASSQEASESGTTVTTTDNGVDSSSDTSIVQTETQTITQSNSANITNTLALNSDTGNNDGSRNVGDTTIKSGNANVTGTIVNSLNTNIDGVMVAEFNVADDHVGDIVLDYEKNCISGCQKQTTIDTSGNGANSQNNTLVDSTSTTSVFQNNDAEVENQLTLTANSGSNSANDNTHGNTSVTTGDANVSGNVMNFLNNNLSGNVVYGVVNVFGSLVGDIVIPKQTASSPLATDTNILTTDNGSGSTNTTTVNDVNSETTNQFNTADIANNISLAVDTGSNITSDNTGGNNLVTTGDVAIDAQTINVVNSNVNGGDMWVVLVNRAGNWVGQILGAPVGSPFAVSTGSALNVGSDGTITVQNGNNGAESTNSATINNTNSTTTNQTNTAKLTNNVDLSATTGGNSASRNTGGNNTVKTGDANIMLNVINFVNNNFADSNVLLTVVNVFGNWVGNVVTPDAYAQAHANEVISPVGGTDVGTENPTPTPTLPPSGQAAVTPTPSPISVTPTPTPLLPPGRDTEGQASTQATSQDGSQTTISPIADSQSSPATTRGSHNQTLTKEKTEDDVILLPPTKLSTVLSFQTDKPAQTETVLPKELMWLGFPSLFGLLGFVIQKLLTVVTRSSFWGA